MYSSAGGDIVGWIYLIFFFIVVVSCCCLGDSNSSSSSTTKRSTTTKRNTNTSNQRNTYYRSSYSECPSCGAPYYDGYCEECGYPDINQGWLGENY